MTTVRHILLAKGREVWSVRPESSVLDAVNFMFEKNVGALVVIEGERVVGIFSERDIARKHIPSGSPPHDTAVREIMTPSVFTVTPEWSVDECMAVMTNRRIRHLPVLEDHKAIGVVSIGDVVKAVMTERENLINQLKTYITGERS